MIINKKMYIVGTESRPTRFLTALLGEFTEDIDKGRLYRDKEEAKEDAKISSRSNTCRLYEVNIDISEL